MRVSIVHETVYRYRSPAAYSIQYLRLVPQESRRQKVLSWKVDAPAPLRPWVDGFGNDAHVLVIDRPHAEIRVRARGQVQVQEAPEVIEEPGPHAPALYLRPTRLTEAGGPLGEFADKFRADVRHDPRNALESLMMGVREQVDYQPGITHSATAATEAFGARAGVCQDHAHIFVACCRRLAVPARYVSGYLGTESDGNMASHAWAEAFIEGEGWRSYDIANRIRPAGRHVRVAVGLDYMDACPVRGFRRGGHDESLEVEVRVNDLPQLPLPAPAPNKDSNGHGLQQQAGRQSQQ
jgi:transglutaminase-like putative cysteine protease